MKNDANKISKMLDEIERNNMNDMVDPELKQILVDIKNNSNDFKDFKRQIFDESINILDDEIGTFSNIKNSHKNIIDQKKKIYNKALHEIKTPEQILNEVVKNIKANVNN